VYTREGCIDWKGVDGLVALHILFCYYTYPSRLADGMTGLVIHL